MCFLFQLKIRKVNNVIIKRFIHIIINNIIIMMMKIVIRIIIINIIIVVLVANSANYLIVDHGDRFGQLLVGHGDKFGQLLAGPSIGTRHAKKQS